MMIVVVLAQSLYVSLDVALKAKRSADAAIAPIRAVGSAADLISKDFDSLMLPNPESNNLESTVLYVAGPFTAVAEGSGDNSSTWVQFTTIGSDGIPDILHSEGARRVEIGLRTDISPPALVRRVTRNVLATVEQEPEEEVLCRNVKSFGLQFYDGIDWYDDWDSTLLEGAVPTVVQMEILLEVPNFQMAGEQPNTYRLSRFIPLAVGQPVDLTQTTTQ